MSAIAERPVLIVGGSGVFGSRLAEGLIADGVSGVVIAGRSLASLSKIAERLHCDTAEIDLKSQDIEKKLAALTPRIVIDAAGPFQSYAGQDRFRLARAAMAVGADYFDLSDDAEFTAAISELDGVATRAGRAVISGVSSVPALSAAAVRALSADMTKIDLIDTMILPGNRAPRGRSVMAAILTQAGRPLIGSDAYGWVGAERVRITSAQRMPLTRLASPIGAPDLVLMPEHFQTQDVRFRAGLELPLMHRGLEFMSRIVRAGWLSSALPLLPILMRIAQALEPFGTDVGAMRVLVRGRASDGHWIERIWTMIAEAGDGPHVPAIPGRVLVRQLDAGEIAPGARACLDDLTLEDCEAAARERKLTFQQEETPFTPLFDEILGPVAQTLPSQIRDLHALAGTRYWSGVARVTRGSSPLARLLAWAFRFPRAAAATSVVVRMVREREHEVWSRIFGVHSFVSRLSADPKRPGRMWERFGPFSFAIDLEADAGSLAYPVLAGRFLGLPIPALLLPRSETREAVDQAGRVTFDVSLSMPYVGLIVRYRGWLTPDQPISGVHVPPVS